MQMILMYIYYFFQRLAEIHKALTELPYLINVEYLVNELSKTDYLWFREKFIDIGSEAQIPIQYSIPYFLLNYIIDNPYSCSFRTFYHLFDIYNDASSCLTKYQMPHLFQELEAEASVTVEILGMNLANQMYIYI